MAAYCTPEDFKQYPFELPKGDNAYNERLKGIIRYIEAKYLRKMFTDEDLATYNSISIVVRANIDAEIKEAMKCFVYFTVSQEVTVESTRGQIGSKPENNENLVNISKLVTVYNDGVEYWNKAIDMLNEESINNNQCYLGVTNEFFI
jgi:hypothetical protein